MIELIALILMSGTASGGPADDLAAAYPECTIPPSDDFRPYTLCLAETDHERADIDMRRELTLALARVSVRDGAPGERRLRAEQRRWIVRGDRKCANEAVGSPSTQFARNEEACLANLATLRTAQLKLVAR